MTPPALNQPILGDGNVKKPARQNQGNDTQDPSDQDLRGILSPLQQDEFIKLVINIIDSMESLICSHSDMSCPKEEDGADTGLFQTRNDTGNFDQNSQDSKKDVKKSPTAISEVKTEAEASRYLNSWRDSVLVRLVEVLREEKQTAQPASPPRGSQRESQQGSQRLHRGQTENRPAGPENESLSRVGSPGPTQCSLNELSMDSKQTVMRLLLLLLLSLKHYNAHSRVLLVRVSSALGVSVKDVVDNEIKVAHGLLDSVKLMSGEEETKRKAEGSKNSRRWKVGLASVAGAALIGVTGGLAAPLVAAGIGAVMGGLGLGATVAAGYLGAVAGSSIIVGGLFGAYGARMTGKMVDRYSREVEDFAFMPIHRPLQHFQISDAPVSSEHRLRVTIGISGWLTEGGDVVDPWRVLGNDSDVFALRWELQALLRLGNSLEVFIKSTAFAFAGKQILSKTALAPIMGAMMFPVALSKIAHIIDNPFRVARARADKAGEILADALINKAQGERPVTLIGYSLGARVIFSCLISLAKRRAFGLIESAVLIGSPTPSTVSQWRLMRTAVSGRLINVYSTNDSVLRIFYRTDSMQLNIAGLHEVPGLKGVENFDVSDLVSGHSRYQYLIGPILEQIGFHYLNTKEIEKQTDILQASEKEDQKQLEQEQGQKWQASERQTELQGDDNSQAESQLLKVEPQQLEEAVEQRTQERLMNARISGMQLNDLSNA